jgi:hypothetical protein
LKEQILHLDPHDDFISARDKMGWVQTQRVLLIWPWRGRVLNRRLDLVLLHRHAHRLGAHLALVTTDPEVRDHARGLGLPVFPTVEASRRERWRSRAPRLRPERQRAPLNPQDLQPPRTAIRAARLPAWTVWAFKSLAFAAGLAAVLALAHALVPSATVTLTPAARPLTASVEIVADPNLTQPEASGFIPAREVRVELEASDLAATTGAKDVPGDKAAGAVVFTNLIGTPAAIPQGTGLRTSSGAPVRFVTVRAASLEGRVNAAVEVPIQAVDPGPVGNVAAALINRIDGPLGLQLAVINPASTAGGATVKRAAVTLADRTRLREQLIERLMQDALSTLTAQLQPGEFLTPDSVRVAEVVAETYDHAVGEQADVLNLTLRIAVAGLAVNENDARLVAQAALAQTVPPGERLIGQTQFARDPSATLDPDGRVRFRLSAAGQAAPLVERDFVRALVQGRAVASANQFLLAALPLARPPQIVVRPAWYARWYNRLPWLPLRIDVIVQ